MMEQKAKGVLPSPDQFGKSDASASALVNKLFPSCGGLREEGGDGPG